MSDPRYENPFEEAEERGFLQRYGFALGIVGIAAVVLVVFVGQSLFQRGPAPRRAPEVVTVKLQPLPTPPPPPPPPPEQRLVQEKMIEQQMVEEQEPKPDAAPPASDEIGTNLKGDGPGDGFGLSGNGNAGFALGGRGDGARGPANRWGAYAGQVQSAIGEALRRHPRTRDANFRIVVRIWPDAAGRVTRAQLAGSTGDTAVDAAIQNDVLTGLQLQEPPPEGMPFPIVMRLTARRPN